MRLLLTEGLVLTFTGAAAGLLVAFGTGELMRSTLLPNIEWTSSPVDFRVLALSMAVAVGVGLAVGLVPALQSSKLDLIPALKAGVRDGGAQGTRLRALLTVTQAALSVLLLVGAGLFVRSLRNVRALDLGIQPDRVVVVTIRRPSLSRVDSGAERNAEEARRSNFYPIALARVRRLAGVERASLTVGLPFRASYGQRLRVPGWDSIPRLKGGGPNVSAVTDGYFETVGTRVLRGRAFTTADRAGSEPVALVSETMARVLWPARDAIGACLYTTPRADSASAPCSRIVGIVADTRRHGLREEPSMHYYVPFGPRARDVRDPAPRAPDGRVERGHRDDTKRTARARSVDLACRRQCAAAGGGSR